MRQQGSGMRMFVYVAVALFCCSGPAVAQLDPDPLMNYALRQMAGMPTLGDQIANLVSDAKNVNQQVSQVDARVKAARRKFWAAYPDGNAPAAARAEFEHALQVKDLFYLVMSLGPSEGAQALQLLTGKSGASSDKALPLIDNGPVDGGIPPVVQGWFVAWWRDVSRTLGFNGTREGDFNAAMRVGNAGRMREALEHAEPVYRAYAIRRTMEEYRRQGKRPSTIEAETWRLAVEGVEAHDAPLSDGPSDPYGTAFQVAAGDGGFRRSCSNRLSEVLATPVTGPQCSCIFKLFDTSVSAGERWSLDTKFERRTFLGVAISRVGLADKVAACIR